MSYLVLARKWRPQLFEDVVGQEHITRTLCRGIETGRIAHAYMFTGPRGVGKTTTARILAKALNCQSHDSPTPTPCNECTSCTEITEGRSPDVTEMDGASHRGIEEARELQTNIQYATVGRYRIIIIDEVHMLTREAFNALLKTLEEPPPNVVFIFATTEPRAVPQTIMSRCQRFDFRLISARRISAEITKIASAEGFPITPDAADFIALRAEGSMRDALSMLDQILAAEPQQEISLEIVMKLLGAIPAQSFHKIAQALQKRDPKIALNELTNLLESGIDPLQVAKGLVEHFRNALIAKSGALPEDYPNLKLYQDVAKTRELRDLLRIVKILSDKYIAMRGSDTPRYLLEEALIYLSLLDDVLDINKLLSSTVEKDDVHSKEHSFLKSEPEPSLVQKHSEKTAQTTEDKTEPHHIEIPDVAVQREELPKEPAERFIAVLTQHRKPLAALLAKNTKISYDDGRLLIKFPQPMEKVREELLVNKETMKLIEDCAKTAFENFVSLELLKEIPLNDTKTQDGIPENVSKILTLFDAKLEG